MKPMVRDFFTMIVSLAVVFPFSAKMAAQQPPHCAQILYCIFNQEAAASDSAGIHKYSKDLIGAIVQNPAGTDSIRQLANRLTDQLASAEQAARTDNGRLVPEAAVVTAFNDLMQEIGAPTSWRANEASMHGFREHAASINAFPALFSANRNGTNCSPGEAVFLLSLLLSDNGVLYERNLDTQKALMQWDGRKDASSNGFAVAGMDSANASGLLVSYSLDHNIKASVVLFDRVASKLGF